jgi:hypothetical protein
MKNFKLFSSAAALVSATVLTASVLIASNAFAGDREQAKRIHERLTGLPPSESVLNNMTSRISSDGNGVGAALDVMNGVHGSDAVEGFLGGTLKRMAAPWTNRDQDPFEPLNDYIATFIGLVKDGGDFREFLYEDLVYTHPSASPDYSRNNNSHYVDIENRALPLANLTRTTQSNLQNIPAEATAGVLTSRAGARAFFYLGTNRAMLRFTLMSQLCRDLEQMEDITGVPDRIRQDVSRSPGGDSRLFLTGCVGCHIGMDPLAQSFAYYDYVDPDEDPSTDDGAIDYNTVPEPNPELEMDTRVNPKYHINANNFPHGYVTPNDNWDNYWREGPNAAIGWNWGGGSPTGSGAGAKTMGRELANSYAFAQCQVVKVFQSVCLREPATTVLRDSSGVVVSTDNQDTLQIATMTDSFRDANFNLKQVFAETANYCKGN